MKHNENVMNAHRSFHSGFVVNQPKKIITINTKQRKYLRSVLQESLTGGKINGSIYVHCSASADHRFGSSRTLLMCTIQVICKAASRLNLLWLWWRGWGAGVRGGSGLGEEGHISFPHDSTQGQAEQRSTVRHLPLYSTLRTTVHLTERIWLAVHQISSVGNNNY